MQRGDAVSELAKPAYGQPCNGCGKCCMDMLCPLAKHVFDARSGRCPALFLSANGKWSCGLVFSPRDHAPVRAAIVANDGELGVAAKTLIGAGIGCDAIRSDELQPSPLTRSAMLQKTKAIPPLVIKAALKIWGIRI